VTPEKSLERAGIALPEVNQPVANYLMDVRTGTVLFVSGHGAFVDGRPVHTGRLGEDLSTEDGRRAAEAVMLNLLATVRAELGSLSAVARFVKLVVFVNSTPDFTGQHLVARRCHRPPRARFRRRGRSHGPIGRRGGRPPARLRRGD